VPGTVWFKTATEFQYFNDPEKTKEARSPDGSMSTVGDVGYIDQDKFLYLTDRATFMIISGGVNIYPQECENLLITHPKVMDAAVFGVPNPDLGEEVKAVIQPIDGVTPGPELAAELTAFCAQHHARRSPARSTSKRNCHVCPRANSTSGCSATAIGATRPAGSFDVAAAST
jgi:long-chain acyl-CoA synthetase